MNTFQMNLFAWYPLLDVDAKLINTDKPLERAVIALSLAGPSRTCTTTPPKVLGEDGR